MIEVLRRAPLFSELDDETVAAVAARCMQRSYRRGQVVVTEGDAGDALFVVLSGRVKVSSSGLVLATIEPPQVFGEIAVLDGGPRSATVEAATSTTLAILRRDTLLALVREHRAVADTLLGYLGRMVRRLTDQAADLASLDLPGRVAKLLTSLADERGEPCDEGVVLDLGLTQGDIAAMVGGSRQSVNHLLRTLERRGDIALRKTTIVVKRPETLKRRAGRRRL